MCRSMFPISLVILKVAKPFLTVGINHIVGCAWCAFGICGSLDIGHHLAQYSQSDLRKDGYIAYTSWKYLYTIACTGWITDDTKLHESCPSQSARVGVQRRLVALWPAWRNHEVSQLAAEPLTSTWRGRDIYQIRTQDFIRHVGVAGKQ